jgi:valyl-tRNA synthetase
MTEKRQTSQGYIIRILQHFATKLWNITNFVMLFQAVMKCLSRHAYLDQNFTHKGKGLLHAVAPESRIVRHDLSLQMPPSQLIHLSILGM